MHTATIVGLSDLTNPMDEATIYSADLFADFHPPPPSTPLPRLSLEEELEQRPDNEFYRALRKATAQVRAEAQKEAEALGFSSWEEKERHDEEEERTWLEGYVKEHGHLPWDRKLTEEEQIAQDLQWQRSLRPEREPCDCEEHLHPGFCPQKLRSYKSQGNDPDDFAFLQSLHPTDLNVRVREGDPSNRIPDRWLEHVWGIPSQDRVLCLPPWAKRDETVQRMIDKEEVDETLFHGEYDQNRNHVPPLTTASLSPDISAEENAEASREFERQCEPKESDAGFSPKQTLPSNTTEVEIANANSPAGSITDLSGTQGHLTAGAPTQRARGGRSRKSSAPSVDKTKRTSGVQASGIKKRPATRKEATTKATPSSSIRTRAQGVMKFLALNSSGRATSISAH